MCIHIRSFCHPLPPFTTPRCYVIIPGPSLPGPSHSLYHSKRLHTRALPFWGYVPSPPLLSHWEAGRIRGDSEADWRWLWCQQVMTGSNARKSLSRWDASLNKHPPMQALQPLLWRVWVLGEGYISGVQYHLCACHMFHIWWCKESKFQASCPKMCNIEFQIDKLHLAKLYSLPNVIRQFIFQYTFCGQSTWNFHSPTCTAHHS